MKPAEKNGKFPTPHRMPNVLASWATKQMKTLERHNAHRKVLAAIYTEGLAQLAQKHIVHTQSTLANTASIWLRWSIEVENANGLRAHCKKHGILLGNWYDTPIAPHDTDLASVQYSVGSCPLAERLATRIVNLPTSINTSAEDARHIVEVITQFYTATV